MVDYHRSRRRRLRAAASLSRLETTSLIAGPLLLVAAVVIARAGGDLGGLARLLGFAGLATTIACPGSRGVRLYRAGVTASLPPSVARVPTRVRPARGFIPVTVGLALVLPLATTVAVLALVEWSWLPVAGLLVLGGTAAVMDWAGQVADEAYYMDPPPAATALLERLCMRAGMRVPELVVEGRTVPSAWTEGGKIHVNRRLLKLLDEGELEAVLAHELAHLARRDAAVMEICSAPSRVLLGFVGCIRRRLSDWVNIDVMFFTGISVALVVLAVLCTPPALVIGWLSRLSVLGMSRARELSADAAAATLTGRPSALASALLKLDRQRDYAPRADLRQAEAYAVLCIVGTRRRGLGRLFSTHPPTAERVRRLEELEGRIQAGPYASR
jgi:heat shock protein HtpX